MLSPHSTILNSGMSATGEVGAHAYGGTKVSVPSIVNGGSEKAGKRCYNCAMSSHLLRNCSYPKQGIHRASREALGKKNSAVAINTVIVGTKRKEKI